ncbi:uncharacterized protein LOC129206321 [Grus americana]|uniref:uncharacterized protein LOC129206321 n=1 Tax=Grus americana TaxID=9117 RepID=UPI00240808F7|nr:uncharacterized protein LOC129206321 [Grus americana]
MACSKLCDRFFKLCTLKKPTKLGDRSPNHRNAVIEFDLHYQLHVIIASKLHRSILIITCRRFQEIGECHFISFGDFTGWNESCGKGGAATPCDSRAAAVRALRSDWLSARKRSWYLPPRSDRRGHGGGGEARAAAAAAAGCGGGGWRPGAVAVGAVLLAGPVALRPLRLRALRGHLPASLRAPGPEPLSNHQMHLMKTSSGRGGPFVQYKRWDFTCM